MVCHHGGAGTTATGLRAACPTSIVYFFADQPFWGAIVSSKKVGAEPIAFADISANKLAEAWKFCLQDEIKVNVKNLAILLNRFAFS
jgi:UDP:flavonoid glycosyltransferase YjiC (YdhE family)